MTDPQWERRAGGGPTRYDLVVWVPHFMTRDMRKARIGYIVKQKNKHRCRAWLVFTTATDSGRTPLVWAQDTYLCRLDDLKADDAKDAAKLLLTAGERA